MTSCLGNLADLFVEERQYLQNVSRNTLEWDHYSFLAFASCDLEHPDSTLATRVKGQIVEMSRDGYKPVTLELLTRHAATTLV